MRSKRPRLPPIPARLRRFDPAAEASLADWIAEREAWNQAQPPVLHLGQDFLGRGWRCHCGPLGDSTDLMKARREARMVAFAEVSS